MDKFSDVVSCIAVRGVQVPAAVRCLTKYQKETLII